MKRIVSILLISLISILSQAQTINHWESIVKASDTWSYFIGTSQPEAGWLNLSYAENNWLTGIGGFGYGDGDDNTEINATLSLFLRKKFTISDLSKISKAVLHADFDDGFIAYINGVEIARSAIDVDSPDYQTPASSYHEASLYQNLFPETFVLKKDLLNEILVEGENILAIEVHNENINSSDFSSNFYFSVGIADDGEYYSPLPDWFEAPVTLSSNLPIIKINTNGQTILDDPRIIASMSIINNSDKLNNEDDEPNEYNGRISIELRGSSSQEFPKKPYALETQDALGENLNVSLLGMPAENDWILYSPYMDKSLMRNVLAYKFSNDLGQYASRTKYCELIVNDEYRGVYVLMEKLKVDKNRVNIAKLHPYEITGDDVTGGYILKFDKTTSGADGWYTAYDLPEILYDVPDYDEIVPEQEAYIQGAIKEFEENLDSDNYNDPINGYNKYINPTSFINFMFVNEMSKNVDGYRLSSFLHKDKVSKGGKINMGPVWDFNLGFGNADYFDDEQISGYSYQLNAYASPFWWDRLLQDEAFVNNVQCRWQKFRSGKLSNESINHTIDSIASYIDEAQKRNFNKWKILDTYVWPNEYIGGTYENEISYLKNWIADRLVWLDANMPGTCKTNSISDVDVKTNNINLTPNPFSENININFLVNSTGIYTLKITNITGQTIFTTNKNVVANSYFEANWNGKNTKGNEVSEGMYLCTLINKGQIISSVKLIKK